MGAEQSKPRSKLADIEKEVALIRSSLRGSNRSFSRDTKNHIQENLVKYSNEVSELKGKVKSRQLEYIQKNISQTMREVLTMDSDLDKAAVETDSIVQVPQTRRISSMERPKNGLKSKNHSKSLPALTNSPTLEDIDNKLKTLRSQIKVALQSEDTTQLRVHQETLKVLATSLELIEVPEYTPLGDKKKKIETVVSAQYQRINKALREIRRNRDIKYLSKQKQKEDVMKELEIIRRELEEYDSLSRKAFKAGDHSSIRNVQQNLKRIDQRLSSVGSVDENTKTLKLQMKDKISWIGKYITEVSQKGSQPDLTKAQADYEEIIKNIASGQSRRGNNFNEKLESLHSFTYSISSLDQDDAKKRRQLLSNISESLSTLNQNQIDNANNTVNIGAVGKKRAFEEKIMDSFTNDWQILKNVILESTLTKETFHEVDNVLSDVQNSISETRRTLKRLYSRQHRPNKNLSVSVPNLAETRTSSNFLNSCSEETESVTTKVRTPPIGKSEGQIPELVNVGDEAINIRNKEKLRNEDMRFSRINEIKAQVYYIKEKFETSIQKPNLKTKLEAYITTLEEYIKSDNQVLANSAKILRSDIQDIIKNIDSSMSTYYEKLPPEYYTDIISRIEENVQKLEKTAKQFQTDRNDTGYQDTKKLLNDSKEYVETLDIPIEYDANNHRLVVLRKIENILDECERERFKREAAYVQDVTKTLENLKDRINRFSGPYKGVLYNAIEKDLNKILIDAEANINNKFISDPIVKDTEKFLNILEQRATKDQSFRQSKKKEDNEKMSALKEELQAIKNDIDDTPMNAINLFIGLNSRLDLIKLSLDQLKNLDEYIGHQKEIIYNEIETLKNVVEAKIALGQQDINQTSLEEFKTKTTEDNNKRVSEEMDKIELTLGKLKHDIIAFVGTISDKKYYELDESIMRLIVKMDDLKLAKGTSLYDRKVSLLKEIHQDEELLNRRTKETEHLTQFERDITDIENNFSRYTKSINDLGNLSEKVRILTLNLESSEYKTPLRERKKLCINRMNEMKTRIQATVNENVLMEEKLVQLKYTLESMKENFQTDKISSNDLVKQLASTKIEIEDLMDLNEIGLQQKADLLKELELIKNFVITKQTKAYKPIESSVSENKVLENSVQKELLEIEQTTKRIQNNIKLFSGISKDQNYFELNESIINAIRKLEEVKVNKEDSYHAKKVQLLDDLNYDVTWLRVKADDTEKIIQFEQDLKSIEQKGLEISVDYISDLIEKLEKCSVGDELNDRKILCLNNLKKQLSVKNSDSHTSDFSLLQSRFRELENQISNLATISSESKFREVDQSLQELFGDVQKIQFPANSEHDHRKIELLGQVQSSINFLTNESKEKRIYNDFLKDLKGLKNKLNTTTNRDSIIKIHNKLKFIQADVEKSSLKEKLKNEIHRECTILLQSYSEKINSVPKVDYIGSPNFLKDLQRNAPSGKSPLSSFELQFEKLKSEIGEMETKVEEFSGNENSEEYKDLEEELLQINVKVKKLNDFNKSENTTKKLELKERVVNCLTILDERSQDSETLLEIDKELNNLSKSLQENLPKMERENIDEKLISLQVSLGKLNNLSSSLSERRNTTIRKLLSLMRNIKQRTSNSNSEDSGTSI